MASQEEFQKKVLESLKKNLMAVDLSDQPEEQVVEQASTEDFQAQTNDFIAFGAPPAAGPTSGGNKDIVILPGAGGASANSASWLRYLKRGKPFCGGITSGFNSLFSFILLIINSIC